jgi:VWA domain containing CoxE-like protein
LIGRPADTVLVLISDLFEGGNAALMRARMAQLTQSGVTVLCLLALSDEGVPIHDRQAAADLAALGATVMACTPDQFPDVLATALGPR